MDDALTELTVWCAPRLLAQVEAALWATGAQGLQAVDDPGGRAGRRVWLSPADAQAARARFAGLPVQVESRPVTATWASPAPAAPIGRRHAVGAPGQEAPGGRRLIPLAPGLGFGHDGTHPTTRLAFALLEAQLDRAVPGTLLDLGAGAGLLGILAARAGARVTAVDVDGTAREAAAANARLSGITLTIRAEAPPGPFDAAVANIRAPALLALLPDLVARVAPGGWLVLAGFRRSHADAFRRGLGGWDAVAALDEDGWLGWAVRRPGSSA